jgi:hypothetical protein
MAHCFLDSSGLVKRYIPIIPRPIPNHQTDEENSDE